MSLNRTLAAAALALLTAAAFAPAHAGGFVFDLPRLDWPTPVATPVAPSAQPVTRGCLDQTAPGAPTACTPAK